MLYTYVLKLAYVSRLKTMPSRWIRIEPSVVFFKHFLW